MGKGVDVFFVISGYLITGHLWPEAEARGTIALGSFYARRALRLSPRDPFSAIYYGIAAYAQFLGRDYDEAMQLAREAIRQRAGDRLRGRLRRGSRPGG